jgi:transmembrane sensor
LTDGTTVLLNVASRLEVPDNFGHGSRTVRLIGQAYFHAAHATRAPFIVEAQRTRVQVLGTTFGVRAYRPLVQVAIQDGKVMLDNVVLTARDIAQTTAGHPVTVSHEQNLDATLGFVQGRLMLVDVSLQEAIEELNRWYDVDIRLGDPSLGAMRMHAVLTNGSIVDLMEVLRHVFPVRIVCDGRTLTIYPR